MKVILALILLSVSYNLHSQNDIGKQLDQIIKDTANHFGKFKGSVRESYDTGWAYFNSIIALEGTKENLIMNHRWVCGYDATIADSTTMNKGKRILDTWKLKLMSVLGTEYNMARGKPQLRIEFIDGWGFRKDNIFIYVGLSQYFSNKSLYRVSCFISNQHYPLR